MNKLLIIILLSLFFWSCGPKEFDSEEELWSYIKNPDNGYFQKKSVNGVDFSLLYKPTDLIIAQELRNEDATKEEIDSLRNKYGPYAYFNLSMSRGNQELLNSVAGDRNQFGKMVNTLAFGMKNKIHLYSREKDTIPIIDYVYPRMYGIGNNTSILLVYSMDEVKKYTHLNLTTEDLGFGTGDINFSFAILNESLKLKSMLK